MTPTIAAPASKQIKPILLFDDECGVCRTMARWVRSSAHTSTGEATIVVQPIGEDPEVLRQLNPALDIWDAYATSHLLMCDGSIKLGGEAVAEILRRSPRTAWFAGVFAISVLGFRPFQAMLNLGYLILSDARPLFGCESCGTLAFWARPIAWMIKGAKAISGKGARPAPTPHFTARPATAQTAPPAS